MGLGLVFQLQASRLVFLLLLHEERVQLEVALLHARVPLLHHGERVLSKQVSGKGARAASRTLHSAFSLTDGLTLTYPVPAPR